MDKNKLNWKYGDDYFSSDSQSVEKVFAEHDEPQKEQNNQSQTNVLATNILGEEADYYETLHNNLILPFRNSNQIPRTIAITSSKNGEGVSSVTAKLAISLANHIDGKVLIIDSNFSNPSLHRFFKTPQSPGFGDILVNDIDPSTASHQTNIPNLYILPTGDLGYTPTPKYDSLKFGELLQALENEYSFIVFDCPSIETDPNAAIRLAGMVDGLILVIEAEKTKWEVVERVKVRLENVGTNILGVVLNKRKFYVPKWIYKNL